MYVGQSAGTPVLQVHAMVESDSQRPHFYLCYLRPPTYAPWFHLDETTGILSMNKTLEWSDFDSACEFNRDRRLCTRIVFPLFMEYVRKLTVQFISFDIQMFNCPLNTTLQYISNIVIFNIVKCVGGGVIEVCSAFTLCAL